MKQPYLNFISIIPALVFAAGQIGPARAAQEGKGKGKSDAAPKGSKAKQKPKAGEAKEPESRLIETPEKLLSGEEAIDDALGAPGFKADVYGCVKGKNHPPAIWIQVTAVPGGSAQLLSIKPSPVSAVFQCIASAVSKLKVEMSGGPAETSYPILLPYPYDPEQEGWGYPVSAAPQTYTPYTQPAPQVPPLSYYPPPPPPPPPPYHPRYPGGKDGGFGIYAGFVMFDRGLNGLKLNDGSDTSVEWYGRFTGGLGIFVEALTRTKVPLAVGLELNFSFPKVASRAVEGDEKESCDFCEQDILTRLLLRLKIIPRISRKASFYPLILFGYSDYISRAESRDAINYHGITVGGCLGLEGYTRVFSPFLELRYMFHAGWDRKGLESEIYPSTKTESLLNHNLTFNVGIRLP